MRYSLLDHVVDPESRRPMRVIESVRTNSAAPDGWTRCRRWCGRFGTVAEGIDADTCRRCLSEDVLEGTIQAEGGPAHPVIRGVPRILDDACLSLVADLPESWITSHGRTIKPDATAFTEQQRRTAQAFGEEWLYFSETLPDYEPIARAYFDMLADSHFSGLTLDAGCGMGRWARYAAARGGTLIALDLSASVDVAVRSLDGLPNSHVVQADVHRPPFLPATFDLIYSLGVLHHLPDPKVGLVEVARHLKPGGTFLGYFYYALDNRPAFYRALLPLVSGVRRVIARLPHWFARWLCFVLAVTVYWPLILLGTLLRAIGLPQVARQVPLYEFYGGKSFRILFNDSVDRFATAVEFRYSRAELEAMLAAADLESVRFSDTTPYWKVSGVRAAAAPSEGSGRDRARAVSPGGAGPMMTHGARGSCQRSRT